MYINEVRQIQQICNTKQRHGLVKQNISELQENGLQFFVDKPHRLDTYRKIKLCYSDNF